MENKRLSSASVGIGGTLIIVIFVVLCLTIFAVLSFTTAYSDLKLSRKAEQMTVDYYIAHGKAEEKLAEVYEKLLYAQKELNIKYDENVSKSDNFNNLAYEKVREIDDISVIKKNENNIYSDFTIYYEALGEKNQKICVTLNIFYDKMQDEPYYEIASWNLSNIELPSYEENTFDLWDGVDE